jgi:hypothetical protein
MIVKRRMGASLTSHLLRTVLGFFSTQMDEDEVLLVIAHIVGGSPEGSTSFDAIASTRKTSRLRCSYSWPEFVDASVIHRREHTIELEGFAAREDRLGNALAQSA